MGNQATKQQIKSILDEMFTNAQNPTNWKREKIKQQRAKKAKLVSKKYGL